MNNEIKVNWNLPKEVSEEKQSTKSDELINQVSTAEQKQAIEPSQEQSTEQSVKQSSEQLQTSPDGEEELTKENLDKLSLVRLLQKRDEEIKKNKQEKHAEKDPGARKGFISKVLKRLADLNDHILNNLHLGDDSAGSGRTLKQIHPDWFDENGKRIKNTPKPETEGQLIDIPEDAPKTTEKDAAQSVDKPKDTDTQPGSKAPEPKTPETEKKTEGERLQQKSFNIIDKANNLFADAPEKFNKITRAVLEVNKSSIGIKNTTLTFIEASLDQGDDIDEMLEAVRRILESNSKS